MTEAKLEEKIKQDEMILIAKTIVDQIKYADASALIAWGARQFVALDAQTVKRGQAELGYRLGGLKFKVSGAKHKGYVLIHLMADDIYTVETGKMKNYSYVVKDIKKNIYCDELMTTIDQMIER